MRTLASSITGARARGAAVRRSLVPGAAATAVVLLTASTMAVSGGAVDPPPGRVSFGGGASVADRTLEVPAVSVSQASVAHGKGTAKLPASAFDDLDIPATALLAYQRAALVIGQVDESCGLSWTLLAAIGRVETDHGRYGGARLGSDGTSSPTIRGVALDGTGPVARVRDTDGGRLDGDPVWDRAVGPMQFLPSTWSVVGVDADGDSARSPDDLDDAALAAAVFLCGAPGDLTTRSGRRSAVLRYNPSGSYVESVLAIERSYRTGDFDTPGMIVLGDPVAILAVRSVPTVRVPPEAALADGKHTIDAAGPVGQGQHGQEGQHGSDPTTQPSPTPGPGSADTPGSDPTATPGSDPTATPGSDPTATPGSDPTVTPDPTGTPDPGPTSSPTPDPEPDLLTGVLTACASGWCLDELPLDVGDPEFLATTSSADFDADAVVESNSDELTGLAGTEVSVLVAPDTAAQVLTVNGVAYVVG